MFRKASTIYKSKTKSGVHKAIKYLVVYCLFLHSCSVQNTLNENEKLYKGHKIAIEDKKMLEKWSLKSQVEDFIDPKPNDRFLGIAPFGLYVYNLIGDSVPDTSFKGWVQRKLGQPPVIYNPNYSTRSENQIKNSLYSTGYFNARTQIKQDVKNNQVFITYIITAHQQFTIDTVVFAKQTGTLGQYINQSKKESLLKEDQAYNLQRLKDERSRISTFLRSHGYYYFSPDYLIFELDSNEAQKTIDVSLKVKESVPEIALRQFRIQNIYIHGETNNTEISADTNIIDSLYFLNDHSAINPEIIARSIMFSKGQYYSFNNYVTTLDKLSGLGVFKFSNVNYKTSISDSSSLSAHVHYTRSIPISLRTEFQAVSKSNDYIGPVLELNYSHRNFLQRAALFTFKFNALFETQFSQHDDAGNAYELGIESSLTMPSFIFPVVHINNFLSKKYTPKTNIKAGYSFHFRQGLFQMNNLDIGYSFNWRETPTKTHKFKLLNINYSKIKNTTAQFNSLIEQRPLLRKSFSEQLIFSMDYTFTYNNQLEKEKRIHTYFSFNPELSGNTFSLYNFLANGEFPSTKEPAKLWGIQYAQYARLDADYRVYYDIGKAKIAGRFKAGVGKAYGNTDVLPYRKKYYVGGAADLRAFQAYSVGPGNYRAPDSLNSYFEQVGDLKLMANIEYRFDVYRFLKGALFLDAGNIWILENGAKGEKRFNLHNFINETAIGTGFGLRIDANLLVLRFDLGIPLRKPWLEENKWVHQYIAFDNQKWRKENLVLNVAIGYPF